MTETDWVKMRVRIAKDPKIIRMAGYLLSCPEFVQYVLRPFQLLLEIVTEGDDVTSRVTSRVTLRDVTRYVTDPLRVTSRDALRAVTVTACVTALIEVWGTAREQGRQDGESLILEYCSLDDLSAIAGVPKFGHAMAHVEWAIAIGDSSVKLPKFFSAKELAKSTARSPSAARQQRYRERQKAKASEKPGKPPVETVTRDVTRCATGDVTNVTRNALEEEREKRDREREEAHTPIVTSAHPGDPVYEVSSDPTPEWIPESPAPLSAISAIEIGGELVFYQGMQSDFLRWEAEFIRRWNALPGVQRYDYPQLSDKLRRTLRRNLSDPHWQWKVAFAKAPFWTPTHKRFGLTWFFEDGKCEAILDGRFDRPEAAPTDKATSSPVCFD